MAVMERFQQILKDGALPKDMGGANLPAQAKYDFLAALHSMEQLTNVIEALEKRKKKRETFKGKIVDTCRKNLSKLLEGAINSSKDVDKAIEVLKACKQELTAMEAEEAADKAIAKLVEDGVSAGR